MKQNFFEKTLNLLYGASFALTVVGAFSVYFLFYHHQALVLIFLSFLGALPGIILYILCELALMYIHNSRQIDKQTKLLEKIVEKLSDN